MAADTTAPMKPGDFILLGRNGDYRLYWGRYPVGRIWSRKGRTWFAQAFDSSALDGTDRRWRGIYGTRAEAQAGLQALITAAAASGRSAALLALAPIPDGLAYPLILATIRKAGPWRCQTVHWPKRCLFPAPCRCAAQARAIEQLIGGRPGG